MAQGIYGDTTRELRAVWNSRVVKDSGVVNKQQLQTLFNDLNMFPSQAQIHEMIQCARECSEATEGDKYLTFGEFCIFATELRKYYNSGGGGQEAAPGSTTGKGAKYLRTQKSGASAYDVFLGGSCNPTSWRQDVAIPALKAHGITFYNPQQSNWVPEMIELEHQAKQTSQILFFVLNEKTRNVVSMIEVAYLAGANRRLIVVINPYPSPNHTINGEAMSESEFNDLNNGLITVHDLVERQGLPVFSDISVALRCTKRVLKDDVAIEDLGLHDSVRPVKLAHVQIGDRLVRLREAFDTLDTSRTGRINQDDLKMAFRIHAHRDLSQRNLKQIASVDPSQVFDFEQFCCIVSEFKNAKSRSPRDGSRDRGKTSRVLKKFSCWMTTPFMRRRSRESRVSAATCSNPGRVVTGLGPKRRGSQIRDVYLGGTMKGNRWREKDAIPMLKKHGLTFFNPQTTSTCCSSTSSSTSSSSSFSTSVNQRSRRLIPIETAAMDNSRVLLFVILGTSRSMEAMCEAAYYIGKGAPVVLCVQKIQDGTPIDKGEVLSKAALKDFNRGRAYLSDIANREGVPVFDEIREAVDCILQKCKSFK